MSRFTHFCPFQLPMGTAGGSLGQKTSFLALLGGDFVPPCVTVGCTGYACGYGYGYHHATSHDKKPYSTFWGHFTLFAHFPPNIPISLPFMPPNTVFF